MVLAPVHPEGPRYHASVVFVPGLWMGPAIWQRAAGFLAHRGWAGFVADGRACRGGVAERAQALRAAVADLEGPPVFIGHDAGGLVALEVARVLGGAAVVWAAPVLPGGRRVRASVDPWRVLRALVFGGRVPRPGTWDAREIAPAWALGDEDGAFVVDVVRGRVRPEGVAVPIVLVGGDADARCPPTDRAGLAAMLGAEELRVVGAGSLPLATGAWQQAMGGVHRWLVRRLGAPLLELHDEAMQDRDAADD